MHVDKSLNWNKIVAQVVGSADDDPSALLPLCQKISLAGFVLTCIRQYEDFIRKTFKEKDFWMHRKGIKMWCEWHAENQEIMRWYYIK